MAIIYSYPKNTGILSTDIIAGTSTKVVNGRKQNVTKSFELGAIAMFYNETSSIAITGQNNFFFQNNIAPFRKAGSISFISGGGAGTAFSGITTLRISKYATSGTSILEYLNTLVEQAIIIAQVDNLNNFGVYKFNSITEVVEEPGFYDVTLESVNANGTILEGKFYGFAVYPGFVNPNIDPGGSYDFILPLVDTDGSVTINQASSVSNGYLSFTDWNTFNNKAEQTIRRNAQYGQYNYCGYAPQGSLESEDVWTITKITINLDGSVATEVFTEVAWSSVPI